MQYQGAPGSKVDAVGLLTASSERPCCAHVSARACNRWKEVWKARHGPKAWTH